VTRERVRQLEFQALRRLRCSLGAMEDVVAEYSGGGGGAWEEEVLAARTSSGGRRSS